jgi:2-C-methyl-D-erythritol 4-phosphate cytidylyltransferase
MTIALVTAAGRGSRMKQEVPKQFMPIKNKPLIIYTLEAFQKHPNVDAIIVPCLRGWEQIMWAYIRQYNITKVKWVIDGGVGDNGQLSINLALKELAKSCDNDDIVLVHDGNRALISEEIISDSIVTCREKGNAVAVIPCNEVIVRTSNQESSTEFLNRDELKRTQTPHTFPLGKLLWAHEEAQKRGIEKTVSSCDLMMLLGEEIHFSVGSEKNMKITNPVDVEIFQSLLSISDEM